MTASELRLTVMSLNNWAQHILFNNYFFMLQKQEVYINAVDFTSALHHVRPSVQRSSDLFLTNMPHMSWDDIGGLAEVKDKLKQVLLLAEQLLNLCHVICDFFIISA